MARRVQKDWYQILQVHPEADPETIQAAYRSLLRRCHPDKNPDRRAWAEQRTRELNEAYAVLSNAERRREFDALRARWGAGAFGTPRTIRTPGATAAGLGADAGYSLLFRENRRLEAQVARLQGEKAQLEAELVRTRTELQELQKRVEDLRRRLEESDGQRRRLEQALAVANKQRQLLQERLDRPRSAPSGEGLSTRNRRIASKRTISLPGDRVTVTFVWIPGGSFTMGCAVGSEDESPEHTVELDGFWMSQTPITCRQFAEFVRQQPAWSKRLRAPDRHPDYLRDFLDDTPPRGRENTPVTWVTWYAAAAFCEWAGFLLPTEAQWEYAAKGGENLRYATTNGALLPRLANYGGKVGAPTPVRRYPPNPFELYDLAGNVWEWCADRYEPDFYRQPAATAKNPICGPRLRFREGDWKKALGPFVIRGGSWQSLSMDLRTSARAHQDGTLPSAFCGFRCVLPPD